MGVSLGEFLRLNVKDCVDKGYYDVSVALEAAKTQHQVSRVLTTRLGLVYVSTSTPIFDEQGKVKLTVTNAVPIDHYEKVTAKRESHEVDHERRALEYMFGHVLRNHDIVAESHAMRELLLMADAVAQTDSTVLITGETGCGKEVVANYIHAHSRRMNKPFVAINAAALPEHLVEAELFGYERGAFTGARSEGQSGLFAEANGGTLFLDEIAELPLVLQGKLLRVLESGEVRRVGGRTVQRMNVRLIAATHRNLKEMVNLKLFREDLYYRLNVIPLHVPPLRERPEDIRALAVRFVGELNEKYDADASLDTETLERLVRYEWPGNVRELRNHMEQYVFRAKCQLALTNADHLATLDSRRIDVDILTLIEMGSPLREVLSRVEEIYVKHMLSMCDGKIGLTASRLGIYRTALHRKLRAYRDRDTDRHREPS